MVAPRDVRTFVARLEDRIEDAIEGHERVALAYSGGLASTLIAMIARKRCELNCFVAGTSDSPDVKAAIAAKRYFDYRTIHVAMNRSETRRVLAAVARLDPRLSQSKRGGLVPICAVIERASEGVILTGYGRSRRGPGETAALEQTGVRMPLHELRARGDVTRELLRSAAISLGLPVEWARTSHRDPEVGAGIAPFLPRDGHMLTKESAARP